MSIEKELVEATAFEARREYANRQDYLAAMIRAVNELDEDIYNDLSTKAVDWFNVGVRCVNNKKPIPDFDGKTPPKPVVLDESEGDDSAEVEAAEAEVSIPAPKRTKESRPKPAKAAKEPAPTKTVDEIELDKYGIAVGSKNNQAAAMLEKGCKMAQISTELGGTYYNLVKRLEKQGHKILRESSGVIRLVHADKAK